MLEIVFAGAALGVEEGLLGLAAGSPLPSGKLSTLDRAPNLAPIPALCGVGTVSDMAACISAHSSLCLAALARHSANNLPASVFENASSLPASSCRYLENASSSAAHAAS